MENNKDKKLLFWYGPFKLYSDHSIDISEWSFGYSDGLYNLKYVMSMLKNLRQIFERNNPIYDITLAYLSELGITLCQNRSIGVKKISENSYWKTRTERRRYLSIKFSSFTVYVDTTTPKACEIRRKTHGGGARKKIILNAFDPEFVVNLKNTLDDMLKYKISKIQKANQEYDSLNFEGK